VGRVNRQVRFAEKLRYKWRQRKWVIRFVLLALDRWWRQATEAAQQERADTGAQQRPPSPFRAAG
jgi:hypothetical protein